MDDNHVPTLHHSQHEWAIRLTRVVQPLIYEGVNAMFQEAVAICTQSEEEDKYLMTFQNILSRIPKWNEDIIKKETDRIIERSGYSYLDDLLTCVHIAQLKILTSIRTGKAQKKVEIDIPKLSSFIHKVYTMLSRDLYTNVYLFEKGIAPLVVQQNRSKINEYIKDALLNVIRDSIPIDQLLRAYLDETTDLIKESPKEDKPMEVDVKKERAIRFSDTDMARTIDNESVIIDAPKDIPTLEKLAEVRNVERKRVEALESDSDKVKISDEIISIEVDDLSKPEEIDLGVEVLT